MCYRRRRCRFHQCDSDSLFRAQRGRRVPWGRRDSLRRSGRGSTGRCLLLGVVVLREASILGVFLG